MMENKTIHLAIADDHQIVIDGLKLLLQHKPNFEIVAEANSAEQMLALLKTNKINVLLTDITMNHGMNGAELAMLIKREMPGIKIIALTMSEEGSTIARMIEQAHVDGYVPKSAGKAELVTAIEKVAAGEKYFPPDVLQQYEIHKLIRSQNEDMNLTSRELQIIECMVKHYSNKQIADELFISERTVETHRKNIYRKTNTKGEASLIKFVKEHKLLN